MITRIWLRLAEALVPAILALALLLAWQADRRDRAQLAAAQQTIAQASANEKDRNAQLTQTLAQLTAQKQSNLTAAQLLQVLPQALHLPAPIALDPATNPNVGAGFSLSPSAAHTTNSALAGQVSAEVAAAQHAAPQTGESPNSTGNYSRSESSATPANAANSTINNPLPKSPPQNVAPNAVIPSADLKPLYDFALDCQACQAKLAASQADLTDEKAKSAALTKERDDALRVARGGSAIRRIARAAKWFLIGAAAGAVAAKAAR